MKPPVCEACHKPCSDGGDLVTFADYQPLPEGMVGHPRGWEWFCARHLPAARKFAHLATGEALQRIRARSALRMLLDRFF
jgi:hypothetical protein